MNKVLAGAICLISSIATSQVLAGEWELISTESSVYFGSVKKDYIGETHSFTGVSGGVDAEGMVIVDIDLSSVETNIDIRNERINQHVFGGILNASVSAMIDVEALEALEPGEFMTLVADANLNLLGKDIGFDAPIIAVRLSQDRALIVSDGMSYLATDELGIDAGIDTLMELANLPAITRSVPLSVRLVFEFIR